METSQKKRHRWRLGVPRHDETETTRECHDTHDDVLLFWVWATSNWGMIAILSATWLLYNSLICPSLVYIILSFVASKACKGECNWTIFQFYFKCCLFKSTEKREIGRISFQTSEKLNLFWLCFRVCCHGTLRTSEELRQPKASIADPCSPVLEKRHAAFPQRRWWYLDWGLVTWWIQLGSGVIGAKVWVLPSSKLTVGYGKSPSLVDKSTNSMGHFQ